MARVTVEDCIDKVPNRFDLVLTAAQRARNIQKGELLTIDRDDDKNTVIALREIADETIDFDQIEDRIIQSMQRLNESEEEVTVADDASATASGDMSNMIGLDSMENLEDAGMQIGTGDELNATGFEDVDIASLTLTSNGWKLMLGARKQRYIRANMAGRLNTNITSSENRDPVEQVFARLIAIRVNLMIMKLNLRA